MADCSARRLILLRHAKSDWPIGVPDLERPLAERGQRDAIAAGSELAGLTAPDGQAITVDAVLCSPARRTRQTWRLVARALHPIPAVRVVPDLYGADVDDVLDVLAIVPHDVHSVLLIGHEPTMSSTATALAGPGSATDDLARLEVKYPTAGMTVLRLTGSWAQLSPGSAVLERFLVPRG